MHWCAAPNKSGPLYRRKAVDVTSVIGLSLPPRRLPRLAPAQLSILRAPRPPAHRWPVARPALREGRGDNRRSAGRSGPTLSAAGPNPKHIFCALHRCVIVAWGNSNSNDALLHRARGSIAQFTQHATNIVIGGSKTNCNHSLRGRWSLLAARDPSVHLSCRSAAPSFPSTPTPATHPNSGPYAYRANHPCLQLQQCSVASLLPVTVLVALSEESCRGYPYRRTDLAYLHLPDPLKQHPCLQASSSKIRANHEEPTAPPPLCATPAPRLPLSIFGPVALRPLSRHCPAAPRRQRPLAVNVFIETISPRWPFQATILALLPALYLTQLPSQCPISPRTPVSPIALSSHRRRHPFRPSTQNILCTQLDPPLLTSWTLCLWCPSTS